MSQQTNIRRRPGSPIYYARVTVPIALRKARVKAGLHVRPEVWRSLRTSDPKVAGRTGPAVVEQIKSEFDRELEMLARGEVPQERRRHVPTDHELEERLFSLLTADLRDDQISRFSYPRQQEKERLVADGVAKARAAAQAITDPQQAQLVGIIAWNGRSRSSPHAPAKPLHRERGADRAHAQVDPSVPRRGQTMIVALLGYLAYSAFAWWVVFWDGAEVLEGWKSSLFLGWSAFTLTADELRVGVAISWIATSIIGLATYFSN